MKAKCIAKFVLKGKSIKKGEVIDVPKHLFEKASESGCIAVVERVRTTTINKTPKNRQMKPRRRRK